MERPKYGMITNPSRDIVREIISAKSMGFDYVELGIEIPEGHHSILMKKKRRILALMERFSYPPLGHTAFWMDIWSDYDEVRAAWTDVAKRSVDAASELGCKKLNVHAPWLHGMYKYSGKHRAHALSNATRSLREIVRYASGRGVMIVLENVPDTQSMTFRDFSHIMRNVPGLGAHIDVAHSFVEGGMPMVLKYIRSFRNKLEHLHFSDNLGLDDDHIAIGSGIIDYHRIMKILNEMKYDKTITLEIFSGKSGLRESLRAIRSLENNIW